uniref:Uncharacterized protein n=1 Tax=Knipowitschia caucasica TaxID=637954 RepID=A0AAV2JR84_KNICA
MSPSPKTNAHMERRRHQSPPLSSVSGFCSAAPAVFDPPCVTPVRTAGWGVVAVLGYSTPSISQKSPSFPPSPPLPPPALSHCIVCALVACLLSCCAE